MTAKLRTIRTAIRSASVKRSDVRSAAKAVIATRESGFTASKSAERRTAAGSRK